MVDIVLTWYLYTKTAVATTGMEEKASTTQVRCCHSYAPGCTKLVSTRDGRFSRAEASPPNANGPRIHFREEVGQPDICEK